MQKNALGSYVQRCTFYCALFLRTELIDKVRFQNQDKARSQNLTISLYKKYLGYLRYSMLCGYPVSANTLKTY